MVPRKGLTLGHNLDLIQKLSWMKNSPVVGMTKSYRRQESFFQELRAWKALLFAALFGHELAEVGIHLREVAGQADLLATTAGEVELVQHVFASVRQQIGILRNAEVHLPTAG